MSNQVYSNDTQKYYALPGLNAYVMTGNQSIAVGTGNHPSTVFTAGTFLFSNTVGAVVNDSSIVTVGPTNITFNKPGMYSINLMVGVETTGDLEFLLKMVLTRQTALNGITLDYSLCRDIAPGSSPGANSRFHTLKYIGFMEAGDLITFSCDNYGPNAVVLQSTVCQLNVNKIY